MNDLRLFCGNSNPELASKIAEKLGVPLGKAEVGRFKDGEISVAIHESVRGADVFVVQSTHPPAENILELLIMLDALKRASADRITAVVPYFGYARQDRKARSREPISAKLMANLITTAGADRVLTMDLHAPQIQGFFDIPVDHLFSSPIFGRYFSSLPSEDLVVVSPDLGSVKMARAFAKRMGVGLVIVDKRRPHPNSSEVVNIIGDVKGKNVLLRDDMIDTGGTLVGAAQALKEAGALELYAACTHPLFSGDAMKKVQESPLKEVVVTDTIPFSEEGKVKVISVAEVFAEAIRRIHLGLSVSSLFE
ncbi:MAG: ribose-phosphate pyrophosphokinase [Candidatus Latescibacterota bacterium]|nr:MAG: ribose-phosphate pyrophosphokinase [Candidatus Latescibacterota bacterium]RKY74571.1 MAG: ribose-phosphate pyrophosphokinase [Candidatus Latescibacterota bacterium]HDI00542.1 ribose-phosphate pyrophosphokinase [Bacillota bacterium]